MLHKPISYRGPGRSNGAPQDCVLAKHKMLRGQRDDNFKTLPGGPCRRDRLVPRGGCMSIAALTVATATLAIWAYLIVGRGGFWLVRERDEVLFPSKNIPHAEVRRTELIREEPRSTYGGSGSFEAQPFRASHLQMGGVESGNEPQEGEDNEAIDRPHWPSVMAIIPARDEAAVVGETVGSLLRQDYPGRFTIVVVDDQSTDGTAEVARRAAGDAADRITILRGADLPPGWTGKLWAMRQGVARAESVPPPPDFLLFTDADIAYASGVLQRLVTGAVARGTVLTSLMVKLRCESRAERLLIPPFVFFFQKLYPFPWVNDPARRTAAAAGGCMLVRRDALARAGGLEAISTALIDDCALGALLKRQGPIWLGLTDMSEAFAPIRHSAISAAWWLAPLMPNSAIRRSCSPA